MKEAKEEVPVEYDGEALKIAGPERRPDIAHASGHLASPLWLHLIGPFNPLAMGVFSLILRPRVLDTPSAAA